jgi:uncharacterized membrane protein
MKVLCEREGNMKKFVKSQLTFLLFGLVFWLPVVIIVYILFLVLSNIENFGEIVLEAAFPDAPIYTGFGIALFLVIVYITGIVLKSTRIGNILSKIPFLGLFFGKGEIITIGRLLHMQPCLFLISPTCISYGWILSEEKIQLSEEKAVFTLINVYYPNVPSLVTGQVYPMRKESVMKLANSSREMIDLLLYAFRSPSYLKYLPWENEPREEFEERAKSFGLNLNTQ